MKSEKLLSLIGEIDDKFIEEASVPYKRKPHYVRYGALAASFLILIFAVFSFINGDVQIASDNAFNGLAPETAIDGANNFIADYTTTADSHDDVKDTDVKDYGYGFMAVIISIDAQNRTITVDFNEENQFFSDIIEIDYNTLSGAEPFENFKVSDEIEVLVSVNDIAEIVSIRK